MNSFACVKLTLKIVDLSLKAAQSAADNLVEKFHIPAGEGSV